MLVVTELNMRFYLFTYLLVIGAYGRGKLGLKP